MAAPTDAKVAFFTDTYHPQVNGLVTAIDASRAKLPGLGWQVLVFAPHLRGEEPDPSVVRLLSLTYPPQPEYSIVLPWGRGLHFFGFKRHGLRLIHSHAHFSAGLIAAALAFLHKLPLVMTYHTLWEDYAHYTPLPRALTLWFNRAYTRWLCRRCELVIAPSQAIAAKLRSYGVATRVEVLPTGLTDDAYAKTGVVKSSFGAGEGVRLLSSAGRLGPEKRFHLLLRALASAGSSLGPWRLCLAGDGPQRGELEALAKELGIAEQVRFLGYLPRAKVLDLMEASDLFVFPSPTETQGLVVIESMARGTPVLGVDAMGVGATLAGERGGWLARPDDISDLSSKLQRALGDPAALAAKAAEAEQMARGYAAGEVNAKLAELYQGVVDPA